MGQPRKQTLERDLTQAIVEGAALRVRPIATVAGASSTSRAVSLIPAPARALLLGTGHPATAVWAYSGTVPGPVLRLPQGEPFRAVVENRL